ncbi:MAG: redox-sensing transcriptional repressor Rex [Lachnospiraceae bacterium]|nr:redox-sensing transcriptional repressor Rex [Lachnospiraceae bacterium]
MGNHISDALIQRLPGYYRHLRELEASGIEQVSSQELGERMAQTSSLVRQDINSIGGAGRQGYGYQVSELKNHIRKILGLAEPHTMILIGAGNMGSAVARYASFANEGFETVAMFDNSPSRIGTMVGSMRVQDISELADFVKHRHVDIAVLAIPAPAAQAALDEVIQLGIRGIWNFAPVDLKYDAEQVDVVNVHLSDTLQVLSYRMCHRAEEKQEEN